MGLGLAPALAQGLNCVWGPGEVLTFAPLLEFKGLAFWVLETLMLHVPPTLEVIA